MLDQMRSLGPSAAAAGCNYLAERVRLEGEQDSNKASIADRLKDNVRKPMAEMMRSKLQDSLEGYEASESVKETRRLLLSSSRAVRGRKLSEMPELGPLVHAWWEANPHHHSEGKFLAMQMLLENFGREADRLLSAAPRAVARNFVSRRGEAALWEALGGVTRYLEEHEGFTAQEDVAGSVFGKEEL